LSFSNRRTRLRQERRKKRKGKLDAPASISSSSPNIRPDHGGRESKVTAKTRTYTDYSKGAGVDRENLADALPRLADTAERHGFELSIASLKTTDEESSISLSVIFQMVKLLCLVV
jgi:hypothetical protein